MKTIFRSGQAFLSFIFIFTFLFNFLTFVSSFKLQSRPPISIFNSVLRHFFQGLIILSFAWSLSSCAYWPWSKDNKGIASSEAEANGNGNGNGYAETSLALELITLSGQTMGTTFAIKYFGDPASAEDIAHTIDTELIAFNALFSTYVSDSEISKLNDQLREFPVGKQVEIPLSPPFFDQLQTALSLSTWTDGAFDVTVGPLLQAWGFGVGAEPGTGAPDPETIDQLLQKIGAHRIALDTVAGTGLFYGEMALDFSAIAKGRGVDLLGELLADRGIDNYLIEIGGEIRSAGAKTAAIPAGAKENTQGKTSLEVERGHAQGEELQDKEVAGSLNPWRISIASPKVGLALNEEPKDQPLVLDLPLTVTGVATSGNYHNYVTYDNVRYPHIIDPRTGVPVSHDLVSVTVLAETCEMADALATAFTVMGGEKGRRFAEEHDLAVFFIETKAEKWGTYTSPALTRLFALSEK